MAFCATGGVCGRVYESASPGCGRNGVARPRRRAPRPPPRRLPHDHDDGPPLRPHGAATTTLPTTTTTSSPRPRPCPRLCAFADIFAGRMMGESAHTHPRVGSRCHKLRGFDDDEFRPRRRPGPQHDDEHGDRPEVTLGRTGFGADSGGGRGKDLNGCPSNRPALYRQRMRRLARPLSTNCNRTTTTTLPRLLAGAKVCGKCGWQHRVVFW